MLQEKQVSCQEIGLGFRRRGTAAAHAAGSLPEG
jgi:hypothetical protein